MTGFALPLGALLHGLGEEKREEAARPLHEAQIMELQLLLLREQKTNPFKVGDLVTPTEDGPYINHGEPFIVVEVLDEPVRLAATVDDHASPGCYEPHDLRVAGYSRGGSYVVWLQRSIYLEKYVAKDGVKIEKQTGDAWVEWTGGKCPVSPETVVQFQTFEQGRTIESKAKDLQWEHAVGAFNIARYRIVS